MSASYVKFNQFVEDLVGQVHDLFGTSGSSADALKIYLTNTAPNAVTNAVKGDLAEIATGNGYAGAQSVANTGTRSTTTVTVQGTSLTITASGGTIGPFRYVVLYNDTPTSPADPLVGYWDYGSSITLQDGESFSVKFDGAAVGAAGDLFTLS